ncbi:MAG: hypothetical protein [Olavius algarvensis Delta 4 endosymbiont]|nr:MAG: hypothetical protein [Olavius algarvensis Delta 4 endosymbiont]
MSAAWWGAKPFGSPGWTSRALRPPPWVCLTTKAYSAYLDATGLRERIALEVHRKAFEAMR